MAVAYISDAQKPGVLSGNDVFTSFAVSGTNPTIIIVAGSFTTPGGISSIVLSAGLTGGAPYLVVKQAEASGGANGQLEIWAIPAPSGTGTITVSYSTSVNHQCNAILMQGANQTTPCVIGDAAATTGSTSPLSATPANLTANDAAVYAGANFSSGDLPHCITGVETFENNSTSVNAAAGYHLGTGAVQCTWGTTAASETMVAVRVQAAGGTAPPQVFPVFLPRNTLGRGVRNLGQMALLLARQPKSVPSTPGALTAALADISLTSDALTRVLGLPRPLADTSLTADALPPTVGLFFASADTSLSSDSLTRSAQPFARSTADASATADSLTRVAGLPRSTADTNHTTDSLTRVLGLPRATADASSTSDSLTRVTQLVRSTADTSLTSDSLTGSTGGSGASSRSTADTSVTSDALTPRTALPRPLADTSHSTDTLTRVVGLPRVLADSSTTTDSLARGAQPFARSSTDTSLTSDVLTGVRGGGGSNPRLSADTSLTSDATAPATSLARSTGDSTATADALGRTFGRARAFADTSLTSDAAARASLHYARTIADVSLTADRMTATSSTGQALLGRIVAQGGSTLQAFGQAGTTLRYFAAAGDIAEYATDQGDVQP